MEIFNVVKYRWFKAYILLPSIPFPCPLLKRFYSDSIYVDFDLVVTAFKVNAMLWNLSLLYIEDHLYCYVKIIEFYRSVFFKTTKF